MPDIISYPNIRVKDILGDGNNLNDNQVMIVEADTKWTPSVEGSEEIYTTGDPVVHEGPDGEYNSETQKYLDTSTRDFSNPTTFSGNVGKGNLKLYFPSLEKRADYERELSYEELVTKEKEEFEDIMTSLSARISFPSSEEEKLIPFNMTLSLPSLYEDCEISKSPGVIDNKRSILHEFGVEVIEDEQRDVFNSSWFHLKRFPLSPWLRKEILQLLNAGLTESVIKKSLSIIWNEVMKNEDESEER